MAESMAETDPDFEPLCRPRSCTWPLPRPEFIAPAAGSETLSPSPSVKREPNAEYVSVGTNNLGLLEETGDYGEQKPLLMCSSGDFQCQENCAHHQQPSRPHHHQQLQQQQQHPGSQLQQLQVSGGLPSPSVACGGAGGPLTSSIQRKSTSSRRNAWGNMSYADLITRAIEGSPEKRLTLSQIYEWMVKSVPYFKDKGDSNSSAGWKNSIRHNLSLHSRFVRIQNEGTGKSSWWMLNPEGGKNGKSPRRRAASMDNNSKFTKSRARATKKKVTLQEGIEDGVESPSSQYSKWLGSPNSHSNDDFEAWSTFRTRASSDASTLSGRHSPFLSEQDDLGEADAVHMAYPGGGAGTKMASTLPSLSELGGSMGRRGTDNVMDGLLDNLNLLSPKSNPLGSDSPHSSHSSPSAMLQNSPYSSPSMPPQPPQDYHKCLYSQPGIHPLSPVPMQALPNSKTAFGSFQSHYNCPAGLLKELLTSDAERCRDMVPFEAAMSQAGRDRCLPPRYSSQMGRCDGVKMMSAPLQRPPHTIPHVHPQPIHSRGPSASQDVNSSNMISLTSPSSAGGPPHLSSLRTYMQLPRGHSVHTSEALSSYGNTNGHRNPGPVNPRGHHHQERLPSDLDNMPIESFDCDLESVLHDTLMDGDALDFNFDPAAGPQGFAQRVKTSSHSWVSG